MLVAVFARADDDGHEIPITAPGTIWTTDGKVKFAWSLVNSHQESKLDSLEDTQIIWKLSEDLNPGDRVQVWVYDSEGKSGKTAKIEVLQGGSDGDATSAGGKSKTTSATAIVTRPKNGSANGDGHEQTTTKTRPPPSRTTSSAGKPTAGGGENDEDDDEAASSVGKSSSSAGSSTTSSGTKVTAAASGAAKAGAGAIATVTNENNVAATVGASASSSSVDSTAASSSPDRMPLYMGIGGLFLAFVLGLAIYLWWRQRQPTPTLPPPQQRGDERHNERSLRKQRGAKTAYAERCLPRHA
ncbi:hypothetical protein JCM3770_006787 [Rhodotorula araucariae]